MSYWITTHWPARAYDPEGIIYTGVWVPDGKDHVAANLQKNDLVFKYESRTGPIEKRRLDNGKIVNNPCLEGRMGVVALMKVDKVVQVAPSIQEYTDREKKGWQYCADASCEDSDGFVSLAKLNKILGYSAGYTMRGFGDANSGLKKIDKATFDKIFATFKEGW